MSRTRKREGGRGGGRGKYLIPGPLVEHHDLLHRSVKGEEGVKRVERHGKEALGDTGEQHVGRVRGPGPEILRVLDVAH